MRKLLCIVLAAVLCVGIFAGCKEKENFTDPVNFYYRSADFTYNQSAIASMEAEADGHRDDTIYLMNQYLRGPEDEAFEKTFPSGVTVLGLTVTGNRAEVLLSSPFAQLTGIDLTLACGCIAQTVMELTGVTTVQIRAEGENLDGTPFITMSRESLILMDINVPETTN